MVIRFDHLVVAARTLAEGVSWVESRLGVEMGPGGRHDVMGTHNRLLSLGPGRFLEVIAVDPGAAPPRRPRWFALDSVQVKAQLASGPALVHWVARCDDLDAALAALPEGAPEALALTRGEFRWRIGVPATGTLARGGTQPTLIQWLTRHPTDVLPDSGCRLESLALHHPDASATLAALSAAGLDPREPVTAAAGDTCLVALLRTPHGVEEIIGVRVEFS